MPPPKMNFSHMRQIYSHKSQQIGYSKQLAKNYEDSLDTISINTVTLEEMCMSDEESVPSYQLAPANSYQLEPANFNQLESTKSYQLEHTHSYHEEPTNSYPESAKSSQLEPTHSYQLESAKSYQLEPTHSYHEEPANSYQLEPKKSYQLESAKSYQLEPAHSYHEEPARSYHVEPAHSYQLESAHSYQSQSAHSYHLGPEPRNSPRWRALMKKGTPASNNQSDNLRAKKTGEIRPVVDSTDNDTEHETIDATNSNWTNEEYAETSARQRNLCAERSTVKLVSDKNDKSMEEGAPSVKKLKLLPDDDKKTTCIGVPGSSKGTQDSVKKSRKTPRITKIEDVHFNLEPIHFRPGNEDPSSMFTPRHYEYYSSNISLLQDDLSSDVKVPGSIFEGSICNFNLTDYSNTSPTLSEGQKMEIEQMGNTSGFQRRNEPRDNFERKYCVSLSRCV